MKQIDATLKDRGSRLARLVLRLAGWRLRYEGSPPGCGVIIAYPHTSNWDFVIGILAVWSIGVPLVFLGKDSLFRIPLLGSLLRRWGGIPVDRSNPHGVVERMVGFLKAASSRGERKWLALSPEGTRKRLPYWRTGFYQIAVASGMPVGLAFFNYARREIGVCAFLVPTGNADEDLVEIRRRYAECSCARRPEQAGPIELKPR